MCAVTLDDSLLSNQESLFPAIREMVKVQDFPAPAAAKQRLSTVQPFEHVHLKDAECSLWVENICVTDCEDTASTCLHLRAQDLMLQVGCGSIVPITGASADIQHVLLEMLFQEASKEQPPSQVAVSFAEPHLVYGQTLEFNITLAREGVTLDDAVAAWELVGGSAAFGDGYEIMTAVLQVPALYLPAALDFEYYVAIARAVCTSPRLLLLEHTSSLERNMWLCELANRIVSKSSCSVVMSTTLLDLVDTPLDDPFSWAKESRERIEITSDGSISRAKIIKTSK